jgi:uncharacterized protein (DUF1501 family)
VTPAPADERVLVVLQLAGGNDGLNTLVPVTGRYHDLRPTIGITDADLVPFAGTSAYGLHPALAPLAPLLAAGRIAAVEAVGFDHPDRSHFAALDAWWSATPGQPSATGWLGRWLDATVTGDASPLRAVALGGTAPALIGTMQQPVVVRAPAEYVLRGPKRSDQDALVRAWRGAATGDGDLARALGAATADAVSSVAVFDRLRQQDANDPSAEQADGVIGSALGTAAALVKAQQGTRVIQVGVSGFDTHAGEKATHERLLADFAKGVAAFQKELVDAHLDDRVLLVTVSEFGRRAAENGSGGTDHGKAGVQFVVGSAVKGGVYGQAELTNLDDGDLRAQIDVRTLYTIALDWLGADVERIIDKRYDTLGIV